MTLPRDLIVQVPPHQTFTTVHGHVHHCPAVTVAHLTRRDKLDDGQGRCRACGGVLPEPQGCEVA